MASTPTAANTGVYLLTSPLNLYQSPTATTSVISKLTLTNTSNTTVTCRIDLSSSNAVNTTSPLGTFAVPAQTTVVVNAAISHAIQPTGSVLASCSVDNVVIAKLSVVKFT